MTLLEISGLKKTFKDVKAVKGIDFEVKKGEVLGLLGPNGAGKSTTISMISTLLKPDHGNVYYSGTDIVEKPSAIQEKLGYVPQEIALYLNMSGYENLKFWGSVYGLRGKALKKSIEEISSIIGIEDRLKDKVKTYSGGMKRRLNIGVALLHEPELIIMDEPTVGIDPQSRSHILETVLKLNKEKGMTVIYTSHYMEEVEYLCDRICIMDQGEIIAKGTKEELIKQVNNHVQLNVKAEGDLELAKIELLKRDDVYQVDLSDKLIEIKAAKDKYLFRKITDELDGLDLTILSAEIEEPNLETVFLELTGKALRD
jgi:ABC-2 type transport system ATP-binding protein